ncbi:MAG: metal ABC transporter substrate-binding protein [Clostridia bacterium]
MSKRAFSIFLTCAVILSCLAACGKAERGASGRTSVVATIFPAYDFAKHVCGEAAEVTMLLSPGSESHSYEPTAQDILKIQNCDLFLYTGGESDAWVDKILNSLDRKIPTLRMMDCVTGIEEEHEPHEGAEAQEYDEHVWTSPVNAAKITEAIKNALCGIDGAQKELYERNAASYIADIDQLDQDFRTFFETVQNKTMIFGDRFPLIYFTSEYGLEYYAAFPGCAEHTEPSAATIAQLIRKIKEDKISTIYYIEFSNHNIADSLADATGADTALFYTCHNVSKQQLSDGATYVSLMRENLSTLQKTMR